MYCRNCGKFIAEGTKFCPNCGTPTIADVSNAPQFVQAGQQPAQAQQMPQAYEERKNKVGLAGFIFSLLAIFTSFLYGITSILGLILSIVGMAKKKRCNKWNGFATAGFVINIITLIYGLIIVVFAVGLIAACL